MNETLTLPTADGPSSTTTLDHLSLLIARGPDARSFLDTQLTRNVPASASSLASPAGYCSPKGRLLASFVIWSDDDAVSLLVSRDIAEAIAKRLRMYVMRSKLTIEDATKVRVVDGLVDAEDLPASVAALAPWATTRIDDRVWIRFPDADGHRRDLRIAVDDNDEGDAVDSGFWRWLDVRAGLPWIVAATQDRFVPQMLNLEALGGVDFKKGCFPGQEVVARSQYLGKLKRRTALASAPAIDVVPAPGSDVWRPGDGEPCGLVVNAERGPDGGIAMLIELPLASFGAADLHAGSTDGPPLTTEALPYVLPDNEVFVRPRL
ncbi:MAG: folate-binding protein [Burkholderiaceae bacterium]